MVSVTMTLKSFISIAPEQFPHVGQTQSNLKTKLIVIKATLPACVEGTENVE